MLFTTELFDQATRLLNQAGIQGEDAETSLAGVLGLIAPEEYAQWRIDMGKLTTQEIAAQYGHDWSRAVRVLAIR